MATMTAPAAPRIDDIVKSFAARRDFSFLGFFSGYRAYQIYLHLSAMSDAELERLGVQRGDLARIALEAAQAN